MKIVINVQCYSDQGVMDGKTETLKIESSGRRTSKGTMKIIADALKEVVDHE